MKEAALVLCGGRSTRMGRDKGSLEFRGETLLDRVSRVVSRVVPEVILVAREGQAVPAGRRVARDAAEGLGPLAGLVAGLEATDADTVFLTSCDVPFLRPEVVRLLLDRARGNAAAAAFLDGRWMPTAAAYGRAVLVRARRMLSESRLRLAWLLDDVGAVRVTEAELRAVDPELVSFRNCNTPDEYRAALRDATA